MAEITFPSEPGIFKKRQTLQESYTPDTIVGRDEELEKYRDALTPVVYNEKPDNVFLYGKTGVGKTASTKYIINKLQQAAENRGIDVTIANINCEQLNTSNQVAARISSELPLEDTISEYQSGWKVYEQLFEQLNNIGGVIIVVLDEIDSIEYEGLNEVFYELTRAGANGYIDDDVKIGTVAISSDLRLREDLRNDVKSSMCECSIEFPPYDSEQLYEVLKQRVEIAFHPGVVDENVIRYCAAYGAQDGGDARKALDLLRKSGDIARKNEMEKVNESIAREAREEMEAQEVVESIEGLSEHERITIYALATLQAEAEDGQVHRSRSVYQRYKELVESANTEPVTYRRVQQYLESFKEMNVTNAESRHRGRSGGTFLVHELNYNVEAVAGALMDTIEQCGMHSSIEQYTQ